MCASPQYDITKHASSILVIANIMVGRELRVFHGEPIMLRFDLPPVLSHVSRWEAFISFVICAASLWVTPWLMLIPLVQGFVRGFLGHYKCPSHRLWASVAQRRGWGGRKENAGAKMFANKILFLASTVAILAHVAGSDLWKVPCIVLMIFTTLEWAFSFCAACSVYGLWYRWFPPRAG
jgi:hypothetical protein